VFYDISRVKINGMREEEQGLGKVNHNEWEVVMEGALHGRPQVLVAAFYTLNPGFKKAIAFRENAALEYEGKVQAFVGM